MNFNDIVFLEDLKIKSNNEALDLSFRKALEQFFSKQFLKKVDRLFNTTLVLRNFKQRTNVMCYTSGTKIYVNTPMFNSVPVDKGINYILHELVHVLINTKRFPELKKVSDDLAVIVRNGVPRGKESDFFTGKHQNIHSDWRGETINYLCNNSIDWDVAASGMKIAYKTVLEESGLFNLSSSWWKKRFSDTESLTKKKAASII